MAEPVALLALAGEAAVGWPGAVYRRIGHPVGAFAALIAWCETRWNRPEQGAGRRRAAGVATLLLLILIAAGPAWLMQAMLLRLPGPWGWIGIALLAVPGLAQRSLYGHVRAVARALETDGVAGGRAAVGRIVGRDTAALDEGGVARAAIESLAESFCDGVVAPLFWLMLLGLPGLWAYKAINTADSLIGHREPRWRAFGWASARADDLANLIPARVAGVLLCIVGGGWRVMLRDASRHASPNAGWPEAAMAGALGIRLAGPLSYDGVAADKPWIGDGRTTAVGADIDRALGIYVRACLCLWAIAGVTAWAR
ncbi:MAG: adenosylcobinamide-phosphate synthase CbiB [Sphingobium sp.]